MLSWIDYQSLLEAPIKEWIAAHKESHITIIVLTRGIPVVSEAKNSDKGNVPRATTHLLAGMMVAVDDLRTGPTGNVGKGSPFYNPRNV